jgi:HSP20 family protein
MHAPTLRALSTPTALAGWDQERMNMATTRWEPFRDLTALQDRVNRIFEDVITRPRRETEQEDIATGQWSPSVDIFETPESIVIRIEVPGIEQQALDVELKDNNLIVAGDRKFEEVEGRNYHRVERTYGNFRRAFSLPMPIRQDQIHAVLKNGVLEIALLKEEKAKPKWVQVEVR